MSPIQKSIERDVERHYGRGDVFNAILEALQQGSRDVRTLQPDDLAPLDELHVRGREGTVELANRINWTPGMDVLDVGSGIGGSSRFLATTYDVDVTGIDLTEEFVNAAHNLSELVGLDGDLRFVHGSALEMPFPDNSFDVVWTQHVQMNIEDKRQFYSEIARVLKPGGKFLFHDIFRTGELDPPYPMPWADDPSYSFLASSDEVRGILADLDLKIVDWEDTSEKSLEFSHRMNELMRQGKVPMFGPSIIMGDDAREKLSNATQALEDETLEVVQAVVEKPKK